MLENVVNVIIYSNIVLVIAIIFISFHGIWLREPLYQKKKYMLFIGPANMIVSQLVILISVYAIRVSKVSELLNYGVVITCVLGIIQFVIGFLILVVGLVLKNQKW